MSSCSKRVVTEVDAAGVSIFKLAGPPPFVTKTPVGLILTELWKLSRPPMTAKEGEESAFAGVNGPPGSIIFRIAEIPPEKEVLGRLPEIRAAMGEGATFSFDEETYGMHVSPTIDFVTVVSGEVSLRVDNGREEHLEAGDCVIQRGTMHAWRTRGTVPCALSAVVIAVASPEPAK